MALTKIQAPDGSDLFIEYDDTNIIKMKRDNDLSTISNKNILEERTENFKNGLETTIQNYSTIVLNSIQNINNNPSEHITKLKNIQLEFGVQIGGEMGIPFITKGSVASNVKVTLTWELKA